MIWWINYDYNWVRWLDELHEHKISNTGWVWNGDERERSGTEQNQGECSTFLNLHFLDQKWSKDLEFCTCKTERTLQILANVQFTRSCLRTSLFNMHTGKAGKSIQWGEPSLKKGSALSQHKIWRNLLAIEFATLPTQTTTSYEMEWKGKQGKCSQTNGT